MKIDLSLAEIQLLVSALAELREQSKMLGKSKYDGRRWDLVSDDCVLLRNKLSPLEEK